jgi:triosephosphate isomerase
MKNKKIIIANWKMNPNSLEKAKKLLSDTKKVSSKLKNIETIVCPPYIYLSDLVKKGIFVGAQNVFSKNVGAHTGMISPYMLEDLGVEYVIIGHSERRLWETNDVVNKKIIEAMRSGLKVILCIGENERDKDAKYFNFLKNQIIESLEGVSKNALKNICIAYEPIWAISSNKGSAITPENLHEMIIFIKRVLSDKYGVSTKPPKILYGGSVNPKNTQGFFTETSIDGLLVGGASLDIKKFGEILKIADEI